MYITIALDIMGGENAPYAVLDGAVSALLALPNLRVIFCGDPGIINKHMSFHAVDPSRYDVEEAHDLILDTDSPVRALKYGKASTMRKTIDLVKEGRADAALSSGNTGAWMVMAKMVLGMITNISRPAIVGVIPNRIGGSVMLDMGANAECDEFNLYQFALMGKCYAKIVLNRENPTIGLLNIGTEETKGRDLEKKTYDILKESGLNFKGFIEGSDIIDGAVDVVVTDGFSGNIVLKSCEGAAKLCLDYVKYAINSGIKSKIGGFLLKNALKRQFIKVDPDISNGAMLIGLNGIIVKSHGKAKKEAITAAIKVTYDLVSQKVNERIEHEIMNIDTGQHLNIMDKLKRTFGIN